MSKKEIKIYIKGIRQALLSSVCFISWTGLFIAFLIKSGIFVF